MKNFGGFVPQSQHPSLYPSHNFDYPSSVTLQELKRRETRL